MAPIKHGMCKRQRDKDGRRAPPAPEYRAFTAMKNRCLNPNQARFKDYGERGITICDRWLNGADGRTGFECFLSDMGLKPADTSLERVDNDGPYAPGNCRWATRVEQARNTRANRIVTVDGVAMTLADAVEAHGAVSYQTALMRLHRGWTAEDAIKTPAKPGHHYSGARNQAQPKSETVTVVTDGG